MKACITALAILGIALGASGAEAKKRIVLVAGRQSHGALAHEFNAGCQLLKRCLDRVRGVEAVVYTNGWPNDPAAFDRAAAIFLYMDGGGGHPAIKEDRLLKLGALMDKGVGLGCGHYAVEVPKDKGGPEFLKWIGGYFETFWSVNPHWDAEFKELPKHPVTRGVKPFKIRDEWYYHMRFPDGLRGVTPVLTAVPPDSTRGTPGQVTPHGSNPQVQARKGMPEHVMWVIERADGGRGFGFTGGHFHLNWGHDDFRKIVLNAILWSAKIEVPEQGVDCAVTQDDLMKNLDPKPGRQASARLDRPVPALRP